MSILLHDNHCSFKNNAFTICKTMAQKEKHSVGEKQILLHVPKLVFNDDFLWWQGSVLNILTNAYCCQNGMYFCLWKQSEVNNLRGYYPIFYQALKTIDILFAALCKEKWFSIKVDVQDKYSIHRCTEVAQHCGNSQFSGWQSNFMAPPNEQVAPCIQVNNFSPSNFHKTDELAHWSQPTDTGCFSYVIFSNYQMFMICFLYHWMFYCLRQQFQEAADIRDFKCFASFLHCQVAQSINYLY